MAYDIFGYNASDNDKYIKYNNSIVKNGASQYTGDVKKGIINSNDFNKILAGNLLFPEHDSSWYTRFNRYGWIYPYGNTATREYLFFTKPDLNIFANPNAEYKNLQLINDGYSNLGSIPLFADGINRFKDSLTQLCSSVTCHDGRKNPYMCILSNAVTSKLDLPGINSESVESSTNMYGSSIQYRSHSLKSDNGYDFTLGFTDTIFLEIYMVAKFYDEYLRLQKMGTVRPKYEYIVNRVLPEQFSIYKILVSDDGESIVYYAKLTGVYFSDVPRSEFSDPQADGFKYSLGFHAQFVEDSNPYILNELNMVSGISSFSQAANTECMDVYNTNLSVMNNEWSGLPFVKKVLVGQDARVTKTARDRHGTYKFLLKWKK